MATILFLYAEHAHVSAEPKFARGSKVSKSAHDHVLFPGLFETLVFTNQHFKVAPYDMNDKFNHWL